MAYSGQMLAMFPGQGSQFVGMGRQLLSEFPAVKSVFEEAEDAAKLSIRRLCLDGPEDELKLTANTQPCILTVSVATWRVLQGETGIVPSVFAGHSLGEYSAVVAAGKLDFARAVFLVRRRGEAMQAAVPAGIGAMAAVINVTADDLQARCTAASQKDSVVEVVNFNSPQQLVVAGHKTAVERLCAGLESSGLRFVMLPVSAPFHSSLMQPARLAMEPLLTESKFHTTPTRIIPNLTAEIGDQYAADLLVAQINSPVKWTQSLERAYAAGCRDYVEIGPGKVLFGLARKSLPRDVQLRHTDDVRETITALS
ncbi:MAG: [Acyl-carrier-protein] S-malonyltransferase [Pseudomonadota bacterium]|jgi:[acyl-carrier-protein] S-malonyltransferase